MNQKIPAHTAHSNSLCSQHMLWQTEPTPKKPTTQKRHRNEWCI